jgi:protein-disulfide isomerase
MRSRALVGAVRERLIAAQAKQQGVTPEVWRKRQIEDHVPSMSEAEIERTFQAAVEGGKVPRSAVLDEATRARIRDSHARAAFHERMDSVTQDLFERAKVRIDWDALGQPRVSIPVPPRRPTLGPDDAPVTVIEFADFECAFCAQAAATVRAVRAKYGARVRFVFMQYPLPEHPHARKAAEAALCANEQGKFWELHDVLFEHTNALGAEQLLTYAARVGLDRRKFSECLDQSRQAPEVESDLERARNAKLESTPTFVVNGIVVPGAVSAEELGRVVDRELMKLGR